MAKSPYDIDLDRNAANFQPLTPLSFLERSAAVFPDHTAIIHGRLRRSYAELYARARQLASALAAQGIARGDTVSVLLANTPAMLECHYGVPMTQAVLNTINTRLDAALVAFQLDHAQAKVLIADREFSSLAKEALALARVQPLVIDYDDPELDGAGERLGSLEYEQLVASGDPSFDWHRPDDEWDAISLNYTSGTTGNPEGRRLSSPRRLPARHRQRAHRQHGQALRLSLDAADVPLQRLVLPMDHLGGGRHPCLPAPGARAGDVRRHCPPSRDPSLRCADRDGDPAQCARRPKKPLPHVVESFTAAAPPPESRAGGDEGGRLQRHARLRPHRNLRARHHQRMAQRMGRAARAGAGGQEGAPGRALRPRSRALDVTIPTRWHRFRATARPWARSCFAAMW